MFKICCCFSGYRIWKQKRLSAEEIRNLILNNPRPIREQVPFSSLIQRAISKRATHEDLVSLWRYVIELRRAHSQYGTNILLKALIEAKSDLARALILVGNMEFSLKNDTDFSKTMKMQLLPSFDGTNSPNSMDPNSIENAGVRSIDVIRALRLRQHTAEYKAQVMSPRHDMMVDILYKSYYSRNHVGSVFGLKKYESFLQKK